VLGWAESISSLVKGQRMNSTNFEDFYAYYLTQHSNRYTRRWHFAGTTLAIIFLIASLVTRNWSLLWGVPLAGYGLAWISHWWFEKNNPASFKNPILSFRADMKMYYEILVGRVGL